MIGSHRDRVVVAVGAAAALAVAVLLVAGGCASECQAPACGAGQTACGCNCVDLLTDSQNCGGCGWRCITGTSCAGGTCTCPGTQVLCGATCVDLQTNPNNCGSCSHACGAGTCTAGACVCNAGTTDCGGSPACVDTQTNPSYCGGCDPILNKCPLKNEACVAGACQCAAPRDTACPTGTPTACVDVNTDPANCGGCGGDDPKFKCLVNGTCSSGTCVCPATAPTQCPAVPATPTTCVNLFTDPSNCGECGKTCGAGTVCVSGSCTSTCPSGFLVCGQNCCTAPTTSGAVCCGSGTDCPVAHSTGLGQVWFDCQPLQTYDETQAKAAGTAWRDVGSFTPAYCGGTTCVDRTSGFTECARWCYSGSLAGYVYHDPAGGLVCLCPDPVGSNPHTFRWE